MPDRPASHSTYIALLRGINVGGKNRLPMDELTRMFEAVGCDSVRTYIQSGNVVFVAKPSLSQSLQEDLEATVSARVGTDIPVILRSVEELSQVAEANPFAGETQDFRTLHVGFLADRPTASRVSSLDPERSPPDEFVVRGKEIYVRLPNGMARTRITTNYLERVLATRVTFRNWKTVVNLLNMATA